MKMKIDCEFQYLCIKRLLLLVVGFGLLISSATVAHTQAEPDQIAQTLVEKQPAEIAMAMATSDGAASGADFEWDPWEPFNEKMFWFNREVLDRFVLKPAATAWDFVLPDPAQRSVRNMFDNLAVVRRVVNNSLQLKWMGAAKEERTRAPGIARLAARRLGVMTRQVSR
jgi:hypothetical protein